ncbi:hypothetical protein DPMN_172461 [Dreissena polymorpha]|uniref:glutaminase n=1 Tax=Dreissena polymorpha TaxID=45954 RepID=A0A9D4DZV7_DREPO|nr:hypothetical protein DPMN_172461 [Dreissena polymorpha]
MTFLRMKRCFTDKPHNPMINAGAIAVCSLLKQGVNLVDRFDYLSIWPRYMSSSSFGRTICPGRTNRYFIQERLPCRCFRCPGSHSTAYGGIEGTSKHHLKAILFLDSLKSCVDVNAGDDMGETPLHLAAKWGYGE